MESFEHYILTRMNLGIYKREDARSWMCKRMKLFDRYLFHSLTIQSCTNFKWVLCFDEKTPDKVISNYDYCDNIQITFTDPMEYVSSLQLDCKWILTSRIDNDDYYLPMFVEEIQKNFDFEEQIIDIDYYQWDMKSGNFYTSGRSKPTSPFMTLAELTGNHRGVYQREHSVMPNFYPAKKILKPLAIQIIHGNNVCNKIKGCLIHKT